MGKMTVLRSGTPGSRTGGSVPVWFGLIASWVVGSMAPYGGAERKIRSARTVSPRPSRFESEDPGGVAVEDPVQRVGGESEGGDAFDVVRHALGHGRPVAAED